MTPPPIVIREAGPDDAAGVVAVLNPIIAAGVFTTLTAELSRKTSGGTSRASRRVGSFSWRSPTTRSSACRASSRSTLSLLRSITSAWSARFVDLDWHRRGVADRTLCGDSCRGAGQRLREALHLHPRRQRGRPGRVRATRLRDDRHGTAAHPRRRTIRRRSHGRALPRPRLGRTPRRCLAPPSSRRRAAVKEPPAAGGLSGRRVAAATRRPR